MKHRLIYSLLLAAAFVGCSKEPLPDNPPLPDAGQQEVKFNLSIREGGKVIPLSQSRSVASGNLSGGFYLMGFLTDKPDAQSTKDGMQYLFGKNDLNNFSVKINPDGTPSDGKKRYWKKDGTTYHTFWAYTQDPVSYPSPEENNMFYQYEGPWYIKQNITSDPAKQYDMLMALAPDIQVFDGTPAPTVNLEFFHATARVMFRVYGSGGAPVDGIQASITYPDAADYRRGYDGNIMFRHGKLNGKMWKAKVGPFDLAAPFALPGTANTFSSAVEVGDLLCIPQTTKADWLTFTLTYIPPGKTNPVSTSIALPAMTLEMEKQYNVTLNLIAESQTLTLSQVTLTDWGEPVTGTVDPW